MDKEQKDILKYAFGMACIMFIMFVIGMFAIIHTFFVIEPAKSECVCNCE